MKRDSIRLQFYFFYISAIVVTVAGLKMASQAVIVLFLSIFIASILSPALSWLGGKGVPRSIAFIFLLILVSVTLFLAGAMIVDSLENFIKDIPFYEDKIRTAIAALGSWLSSIGVSFDPSVLYDSLDLTLLFGFTGRAVGNIGLFLSKALLVLIGVSFVMFESPHFERKIHVIFRGRKESLDNFRLFSHTIQKYFTIKTFTSLLTGVVVALVLVVFGVKYASLWGFLAFLLNFIPVIGSTIAAIPALATAFFYQDPMSVFWLGLFYLAINNIISNVLEPKIMGDGLGLSPAVIFFSLIFWGWVLGPVGMFLAVPLTMTLKIAFDSHPDTTWIGILLSNMKNKEVS